MSEPSKPSTSLVTPAQTAVELAPELTEKAPSAEKDELSGSEQPFVQHLVELRDRLVKSAIAIALAAIALSLFPGPADLYDILAAPLVAHCPLAPRSLQPR